MANKRISKKKKLKRDIGKCKEAILLLSAEIDNIYDMLRLRGIR